MAPEELYLIEQLKSGAEPAYKQLFDLHYLRLVNIAFKVLNDIDSARDCAQDVIVQFFEKREQINITSSLSAYLNRSVTHAALNQKNKVARIRMSSTEDLPEIPADMHTMLEEAEAEARIWKEIECLPHKCRRIFTMNRFEGLSNDEIAEKLSLSKRTVETQISIALKKLKSSLLAFFSINL